MQTIAKVIGAWPTGAPSTIADSVSLSGDDIHVSGTQTAGAVDATYDLICWDSVRWVSLGQLTFNSGVKGGTAKIDVRAGYNYTGACLWTAADANSGTLTVNADNGNLAR